MFNAHVKVHARRALPKTSQGWAEFMNESGRADTMAAKVLKVIHDAHPRAVTSLEIAAELRTNVNQVTPYLRRLARSEWIHSLPEKGEVIASNGKVMRCLYQWRWGTSPDYVEPERGSKPCRPVKFVEPGSLNDDIVRALRRYPEGLTSYELARVLSEHVHRVSFRLRPLADGGFIYENGGQRKGCLVWFAR